VHYGENPVLRNISLEINKGEIISIIGSNGAGKSTTLRSISGLLQFSSGEIEFEGQKLSRLTPSQIVRAGISHCPEGRQLWPDLTVMENLEMGAYIHSDKQAFKKDLEEVMSLFPILSQRKNQLAGSMSGGEQQSLAIARALMSRPKLILFDEPSLGLAPILVESILVKIQELRDKGLTVLLVEQNANAALGISDRGYVMEKGEISLTGKSQDLLNNEQVKKIYLGICEEPGQIV